MLDDTALPPSEPIPEQAEALAPQFAVLREAAAARRRLVRSVGLGIAGIAAAGTLGRTGAARAATIDQEIFNFALNFEYLGAEFYLHSFTGQGVSAYAPVAGAIGTQGNVVAGGPVPFATPAVAYFAQQLANDELAHVRFIQDALGTGNYIAEPEIDISSEGAWTSFAIAAGLITAGQTFNPYQDEIAFLVGAYTFEDVCVTALAGAAASLTVANDIAYAAGLLGAEAYQAGLIRSYLSTIGGGAATNAISAARAMLSGVGDTGTNANSNPYNFSNGDINAQAYRRTPQQVLNIAYGKAGTGVTKGGFFPNGVNGYITST